jgi:hypothetical protein
VRTRAYRRHKRAVKLARRYRILTHVAAIPPIGLRPQQMHAHLRCNCFDDPRESAIRRRREERAWRAELARDL